MKEFQKWLVPRKNLLVRDPRSKAPLPAEGELKDWTGPEGRYWRRRVKVGDVTIKEIKKQPPAKKQSFGKGKGGK